MKKINNLLIISILGVLVLNVSAESELLTTVNQNTNVEIISVEQFQSQESIIKSDENSNFEIAKYGPKVPGDGNCPCGTYLCRCIVQVLAEVSIK